MWHQHNSKLLIECKFSLPALFRYSTVTKNTLFSEKRERFEAPTFLKRIGDIEAYPGMRVKFTACATGEPDPKSEWFKNGEKLLPSDKIHMDHETSGLIRLTVNDCTDKDVGKYSCRVYNQHGEETCHAELSYDSKYNKLYFPRQCFIDS